MTMKQAEKTADLTEDQREILALERLWWQYAGVKAGRIRDQFGWSETHYYQVLNDLIDQEAALAYDPLLVKRLRRMRDARQRSRPARRLSIEM